MISVEMQVYGGEFLAIRAIGFNNLPPSRRITENILMICLYNRKYL